MIRTIYLVLSTTSALLLNLLPLFVFTANSNIDEIQENAQFCLNLLEHVNPKYLQNVGIAPHSITAQLGMLLAGSKGKTNEQIKGAACFKKDDGTTHKKLSELNKSMAEKAEIIRMTNDLFIGSDHEKKINENYKTYIESNYGGEIIEKDKDYPQFTLEKINSIIRKKSNIEVMLYHMPEKPTCLVLGALCCKVLLKEPSEKKIVGFYKSKEEKRWLRFMEYKGTLKSTESTDYEAVSIPIQGNLSMIVVLPKEDVHLSQVEQRLREENLDKLFNNLGKSRPRMTKLQLPEWTSESEFDLKPILQKLGIKDAFNPLVANFNNMSYQGGLYIDHIKNRTQISVCAESKADKSVSYTGLDQGSLTTHEFNVNKPFLYFILDDENQYIHFAGRTLFPEQKTIKK